VLPEERDGLYTPETLAVLGETRPWEALSALFAEAASAGATETADTIHYAELTFRLLNFSVLRRSVIVSNGAAVNADVVLTLSLSADVIVTGARTFRNVADVEDPAANLVGIAASASQGAVTAAQIDERPIMRTGEVLETVPGLIVSQPVARARRISATCAASTVTERLLDDGRRSSGEYANRRARPWLFGRELPHSPSS
jgi:hypothetical protein